MEKTALVELIDRYKSDPESVDVFRNTLNYELWE